MTEQQNAAQLNQWLIMQGQQLRATLESQIRHQKPGIDEKTVNAYLAKIAASLATPAINFPELPEPAPGPAQKVTRIAGAHHAQSAQIAPLSPNDVYYTPHRQQAAQMASFEQSQRNEFEQRRAAGVQVPTPQ